MTVMLLRGIIVMIEVDTYDETVSSVMLVTRKLLVLVQHTRSSGHTRLVPSNNKTGGTNNKPR